jgi:hypothetical protein
MKKIFKGVKNVVSKVAKAAGRPVQKVAKAAEKAVKSPVGSTIAGGALGKIAGGKLFGPAGKILGAGAGAIAGRKLLGRMGRRKNTATASAEEDAPTTPGRNGLPIAFNKGGSVMKADKTGRAMTKTTADAKGRAMSKKPKMMAVGGMMKKGYAAGGAVAAGKATRGYGAARKGS